MLAKYGLKLLLGVGVAGLGYVVHYLLFQVPTLKILAQAAHGAYNPRGIYAWPIIISVASILFIAVGLGKVRWQRPKLRLTPAAKKSAIENWPKI